MQRPYCFYILLTDSFEFRLAQEKRITGFHSFMEQEVKVTTAVVEQTLAVAVVAAQVLLGKTLLAQVLVARVEAVLQL